MKSCARCGKGARTVIVRSHSMVASRRRQRPNLQQATWNGRRVVLCASCIGAVSRAFTPTRTPAPAPQPQPAPQGAAAGG